MFSLFLCLIGCHTLFLILLLQLLALLFVVLVEEYVEVTNQVVALLASLLWCDTITPLQPSQHGLTDVDTTVINDICLNYLVTVSLHNLC